MGCSCQGPRAFRISIDGRELVVWALDEIIYSTILAAPEDEAAAEALLWQRLCEFNPDLDKSQENILRPALLQIYRDSKRAFEEYQKNQQNLA